MMMNMSTDQEKPKKVPFKLCFASRNIVGRSNVQIGKALSLRIITPKFYSATASHKEFTDDELQKQKDLLEVKSPRQKHEDPVTENQNYGWYQISFADKDRSDPRLHFAKCTNPIVKEHLMNYENIR